MTRRQDSGDYDNWHVPTVSICDTDLHNGKSTHGGIHKTFVGMTSTFQLLTIYSKALFFLATYNHENHHKKRNLWNTELPVLCILYMRVLLGYWYIEMKSSQLGTVINNYFVTVNNVHI